MPASESLTDDYVAELLKKDAAAENNKYLTSGLGALLTKRPTHSAPKPNTRFLRSIIRETDSHNAALLAKEAEESKARLRELQREEKRKQPEQALYSARFRQEGPRGKRRRSSGDADAGERKRTEPEKSRGKRKREAEDEQSPQRKRKDKENPRRWLTALDSFSAQKDRQASKDRGHRGGEQDSASRSASHRSSSHRHFKHSRASTREEAVHSKRNETNREPESASPARQMSHRSDQQAERHGSDSMSQPKTHRRGQQEHNHSDPGSDSDPLEAIIGPAPPPKAPAVRSRGRGTFTHDINGIDSRFEAGYDPKVDVALDPDEEDHWDIALEALKDRQKWRTQGANRLRAAGFTDEEVRKWEKGGEKDESDVRWRKAGEGREWDRGKIVSADGVDVKAEWGRLKDT